MIEQQAQVAGVAHAHAQFCVDLVFLGPAVLTIAVCAEVIGAQHIVNRAGTLAARSCGFHAITLLSVAAGGKRRSQRQRPFTGFGLGQ